jgi:hypothetical protein
LFYHNYLRAAEILPANTYLIIMFIRWEDSVAGIISKNHRDSQLLCSVNFLKNMKHTIMPHSHNWQQFTLAWSLGSESAEWPATAVPHRGGIAGSCCAINLSRPLRRHLNSLRGIRTPKKRSNLPSSAPTFAWSRIAREYHLFVLYKEST